MIVSKKTWTFRRIADYVKEGIYAQSDEISSYNTYDIPLVHA